MSAAEQREWAARLERHRARVAAAKGTLKTRSRAADARRRPRRPRRAADEDREVRLANRRMAERLVAIHNAPPRRRAEGAAAAPPPRARSPAAVPPVPPAELERIRRENVRLARRLMAARGTIDKSGWDRDFSLHEQHKARRERERRRAMRAAGIVPSGEPIQQPPMALTESDVRLHHSRSHASVGGRRGSSLSSSSRREGQQ